MFFYVYILASQRNGTLYIGYTDDLFRRMDEHRAHSFSGFTKKYDVTKLVWFETHETRESAFVRERQMKKWRRLWKLELIERSNPGWRDLFEGMDDLMQKPGSPLSRG
jgi:putative endonuclease